MPRSSFKRTQPLTDDSLRVALSKIKGFSLGLPWQSIGQDDKRWAIHLTEHLGVKLHEGDECWEWGGASGKNGERPYFRLPDGTTVIPYRAIFASFIGRELPPGNEIHIQHLCNNPKCVRPSGRHCGPMRPSNHATFDSFRRRVEAEETGRVKPGSAQIEDLEKGLASEALQPLPPADKMIKE